MWPAMSPDMNPIEHVWDILDRRVRKRKVQTIAALRNALQEEWNNLKQEQIRHVINRIPQRIRELLNARGDNTHYQTRTRMHTRVRAHWLRFLPRTRR